MLLPLAPLQALKRCKPGITRRGVSALLTIAVGIASGPLLTSCASDARKLSPAELSKAAAASARTSLGHLPSEQLRAWAAKPGPMLAVEENRGIPSEGMLQEVELADAKLAAPPKGSVGDGLAKVGAGVSGLVLGTALIGLFAGAGMSGAVPGEPNVKFAYGGGPNKETRAHLVLSESPFVILLGEEVLYHAEGNPEQVTKACASKHAKVMVITPEGSYFALARRIHYRRNSKLIVLEGEPMVQSGPQSIQTAKPDAVMTLNVATKTVGVSGTAKRGR